MQCLITKFEVCNKNISHAHVSVELHFSFVFYDTKDKLAMGAKKNTYKENRDKHWDKSNKVYNVTQTNL